MLFFSNIFSLSGVEGSSILVGLGFNTEVVWAPDWLSLVWVDLTAIGAVINSVLPWSSALALALTVWFSLAYIHVPEKRMSGRPLVSCLTIYWSDICSDSGIPRMMRFFFKKNPSNSLETMSIDLFRSNTSCALPFSWSVWRIWSALMLSMAYLSAFSLSLSFRSWSFASYFFFFYLWCLLIWAQTSRFLRVPSSHATQNDTVFSVDERK